MKNMMNLSCQSGWSRYEKIWKILAFALLMSLSSVSMICINSQMLNCELCPSHVEPSSLAFLRACWASSVRLRFHVSFREKFHGRPVILGHKIPLLGLQLGLMCPFFSVTYTGSRPHKLGLFHCAGDAVLKRGANDGLLVNASPQFLRMNHLSGAL